MQIYINLSRRLAVRYFKYTRNNITNINENLQVYTASRCKFLTVFIYLCTYNFATIYVQNMYRLYLQYISDLLHFLFLFLR